MKKEKGTSLLKALIVDRRLPWRYWVKLRKVDNYFNYMLNIVYTFLLNKKQSIKKKIVFIDNYPVFGGEANAVANIANLLSNTYNVNFVSFPTSIYNPLLNKRVKIIKKIHFDADFYIITSAKIQKEVLEKFKVLKKGVIITYHARPGLKSDYLDYLFNLVDKVVFVSKIQQQTYKIVDNKSIVIPNIISKINKNKYYTNNVGIVGRIEDPYKGVKKSIQIASESLAKDIHVWGSSDGTKTKKSRIIIHPWTHNKNKIYDSFDVLLSMSETESYGLIVAEALSVGVPCLLSDIPAHREFEKSPGVVIINPEDRERAVKELNKLLKESSELKEKIIKYWENNYSEKSILEKWCDVINSIKK